MKLTEKKIAEICLIGIVIFFSFLIVRDYILTITMAAIVAYSLKPIYKFCNTHIKNKNLCSAFVCFLTVFFILMPLLFSMSFFLTKLPEAYNSFYESVDKISVSFEETKISEIISISPSVKNIGEDVFSFALNESNSTNNFIHESISQDNEIINNNLLPNSLRNVNFMDFFQNTEFFTRSSQIFINITIYFISFILHFIVFLLFLYVFLKDGSKIFEKLMKYSPLDKKNTEYIVNEMKKMLDVFVRSQVVSAVVQTILATAVFYFLGLEDPLFLGFLTLIFALIPLFGPALVYVPVSIFLIIDGILNPGELLVWGFSSNLFKGIFLILFGFFIISTIDNIIRSFMLEDGLTLHPALSLLGILGGLSVFGILGFILGPLFLTILISFYKMHTFKKII